jgi:hypothetical protein
MLQIITSARASLCAVLVVYSRSIAEGEHGKNLEDTIVSLLRFAVIITSASWCSAKIDTVPARVVARQIGSQWMVLREA